MARIDQDPDVLAIENYLATLTDEEFKKYLQQMSDDDFYYDYL
jgi:hypothetical protein